MFHAPVVSVTGDSSSAASKTKNSSGLIRALIVFGATATILFVSWILWTSQSDPYVNATLHLTGNREAGDLLFRMNCAGCHGVSAQGLLAPNLQEIADHRNDKEIITQVVKGRTPPMPSYQMEPQAMADLLSYLHSIS